MQRIGGYPRVWFRSGRYMDGPRLIPDSEVPEYERGWRQYFGRVEWLRSPYGRLDNVLPQTLERQVHNANVRSWVEHE